MIDSIEANKRNVVSGPAGTGKTLLGEELFRSSANRGYRTLMMCFNQNLGEHLKNQLSDAVEDSDGGSQVSTFHSILQRASRYRSLLIQISGLRCFLSNF